jgi:cytochrome c-type biogenesis protein CcmH
VHKLIFTCLFLITNLAQANVALPVAANPELEKRVQAISEELRCLVCQNQTIADSNADLAVDLKNQVREMLVQGKSNKQVTDYMVERYGDFVMYRPPVKNTTWLLWFGPFLLLVGGIGFLALKLKKRQPSAELPEAEMQRAAQLLQLDADADAGTDLKDTK